VQILTGLRYVAVLSWGDLAVDLFMILSGFLMAHHSIQRRATEPWDQTRTAVRFWVRRFFRIAPLYYALLATAMLLGPTLGEYRTAISDVWTQAATPLDRYNNQTLANIVQHVTFLFGAFPAYAFSTPLPDWSIGLEMQFYLFFPWLIRIVGGGRSGKTSSVAAGLSIVAVCFATRLMAHDFFALFSMPSFLPMKIGIFIIGMWAAIGRNSPSMLPMLVGSIVIGLLSAIAERQSLSHVVALIVLIIGFYYLMSNGTLPLISAESRVVIWMRRLLSGKISAFLGDTSYGVYLLHLIILIPIAGTFAKSAMYVGLPAIARFSICLLVTAIPVYLGAWILHKTLEQPGIRAGKAAVAFIQMRSDSKRAAEQA
jgi:peptidoglycan/LPS O-acetylase OafA/YrhL